MTGASGRVLRSCLKARPEKDREVSDGWRSGRDPMKPGEWDSRPVIGARSVNQPQSPRQ